MSKEYHYEGLRDAMNTQRGWNSIEVVGMTKDEVSIEEVKHILAAQPGLFKELYEKIKAKKLLEIRNEKRAREK